MNFERARFNMVEQQIRTWEVLDERILALVGRMPREDFVPPAYRKLAFVDMNIPLSHGQVMMAPKVEARMLQTLEVDPHDTVLEIGTGSGYVTALLAALSKHVHSVEILPELHTEAGAKLAAHGIRNATLELGDAASGWVQHAPYDVIAVTGSLPLLPEQLRQQLKIGGRLFAIVGKSPAMEARLIRRIETDSWAETSLFETDLPPLLNARAPDKFVF